MLGSSGASLRTAPPASVPISTSPSVSRMPGDGSGGPPSPASHSFSLRRTAPSDWSSHSLGPAPALALSGGGGEAEAEEAEDAAAMYGGGGGGLSLSLLRSATLIRSPPTPPTPLPPHDRLEEVEEEEGGSELSFSQATPAPGPSSAGVAGGAAPTEGHYLIDPGAEREREGGIAAFAPTSDVCLSEPWLRFCNADIEAM